MTTKQQTALAALLSTYQAPPVITLPFKALTRDNDRHALLKRGRGWAIGSTEKYRTSLLACGHLANAQYARQGGERLKGSVKLTIVLHEPDKRHRDIGNYVKMIADALIAIAYIDDSQVDELIVKRGERDKLNPRAEITVEAL